MNLSNFAGETWYPCWVTVAVSLQTNKFEYFSMCFCETLVHTFGLFSCASWYYYCLVETLDVSESYALWCQRQIFFSYFKLLSATQRRSFCSHVAGFASSLVASEAWIIFRKSSSTQCQTGITPGFLVTSLWFNYTRKSFITLGVHHVAKWGMWLQLYFPKEQIIVPSQLCLPIHFWDGTLECIHSVPTQICISEGLFCTFHWSVNVLRPHS